MPDPCPVCGGPHPFHLVLRARSARRWRGTNFDAAHAEGALGAAVMRALGLDPARDFERFAKEAVVAGRREALALNPAERFDVAEGEAWEFHVALRRAVPEDVKAAVGKAAREAVAGARNFEIA